MYNDYVTQFFLIKKEDSHVAGIETVQWSQMARRIGA